MNENMAKTIAEHAADSSTTDFYSIESNNFDPDYEYSPQDVQANDAFTEFYSLVKPHFECNRDDLDNHYSHIDFSKYFKTVQKYLYYDVKKDMTLSHFLLYLKTMSGYRCYLQKYPEQEDPLQKLEDSFRAIYDLKSAADLEAKTIDVVYPYFLGILKY